MKAILISVATKLKFTNIVILSGASLLQPPLHVIRHLPVSSDPCVRGRGTDKVIPPDSTAIQDHGFDSVQVLDIKIWIPRAFDVVECFEWEPIEIKLS